MTRIKAGDILYLPFDDEHEHVFEVGPGKFRSDDNASVFYEVYPIAKKPGHETEFVYLEEPVWIEKKQIGEHYPVRNTEAFHNAWVSLGYEVCIDDSNTITFRKLFDYEPIVDDACTESLSSSSDHEDDEIRSVDSYSTDESEASYDSFVTNTTEVCVDCGTKECSFCKDIKETKSWFEHEWLPDKDSDEYKIKSVIQCIENKHT